MRMSLRLALVAAGIGLAIAAYVGLQVLKTGQPGVDFSHGPSHHAFGLIVAGRP